MVAAADQLCTGATAAMENCVTFGAMSAEAADARTDTRSQPSSLTTMPSAQQLVHDERAARSMGMAAFR
jgi:hypothetical protein